MYKPVKPYLGVMPTIAADVFIADTAAVIGNVHIGESSSVWYNCVIRGDDAPIRIGARTNIQDGTVIHINGPRGEGLPDMPTIIGDDITIGHMALIHACTLEDNCMVGMNATVMDGAVVETGALVAACALVPPGKRVPAGQLWAGSPARFVRKISESDRQMMDHIRPGYRNLAEEYRTAGLDLRDLAKADE